MPGGHLRASGPAPGLVHDRLGHGPQAARQLLLYLADELDVPLRDRNELLLAAGYAPRYPHQPRGGQQLRAPAVRSPSCSPATSPTRPS